MSISGWLQIGFVLIVVLVLVKPLGLYMAKVFSGERTFLSPLLGPVERGFYALAGVRTDREPGARTLRRACVVGARRAGCRAADRCRRAAGCRPGTLRRARRPRDG